MQAVALVWYVPPNKCLASVMRSRSYGSLNFAKTNILRAVGAYCSVALYRETADGSSTLTLCAEAEGAAALVKALAPYVGKRR